MCGIVGATTIDPEISDARRHLYDSALSTIGHRGPDARGAYESGGVWLGHSRLSVLDLSDAANQPMVSADGRFAICYNGEVYNYRELAHSLNIGELTTRSDTEVILRAFAERGAEVFSLLKGMFSIALVDFDKRRIWLVRDRLGIKPMFYSISNEMLVFSSETQAIRKVLGDAVVNVTALHEWLYYGTTLGENTLYAQIRKLSPGHFLEVDLDSFRHSTSRYWDAAVIATSVRHTHQPSDQVSKVRELLERAVERQLVSDVPVGVFLSGGVDSSAITAFASRHYCGRLSTYSAGFDFQGGVNELPRARAVAAHFGTDHNEMNVSGFDVADVVEKMVRHHDAPFSDAANIPLFLLAMQLKGQTKVVLQGDGGDEVFGGYRRHFLLSHINVFKMMARVGKRLNRLIPTGTSYHRRQRLLSALATSDVGELMARLLTEEYTEGRPENVFGPEFRQKVVRTDPFQRYRQTQRRFASLGLVNQMLLVDLMIVLPDVFLEKVDRSTMAAGVEARVPLLDDDLVEYCIGLSGKDKVRSGRKKWLLKSALKGVVPEQVLNGSKTGFGVPYGYWLRTSLKPLFLDNLSTFESRFPGVLDHGAIDQILRDHVDRTRDRSFLLWKILNFAIWANSTDICFSKA